LRVDISFCELPQKALAKFSKLNSNPGIGNRAVRDHLLHRRRWQH